MAYQRIKELFDEKINEYTKFSQVQNTESDQIEVNESDLSFLSELFQASKENLALGEEFLVINDPVKDRRELHFKSRVFLTLSLKFCITTA